MAQPSCKPQIHPARHYLSVGDISDWLEPRQHATLRPLRDWHDFLTHQPITDAASTEFDHLASAWERETKHLSSLTQIVLNPHYQQIIGMGDRALRPLFSRLQNSPGHWFWALTAITGVNPIPPEGAGDLEHMTDAWLGWGRMHGYVS